MNSTLESSDSRDEQSSENIGPYGYSTGVSFGILVILIVFTYSYYVYSRFRSHPNPNGGTFSGGRSIDTGNSRITSTDNDESHCSDGLDEATLLNYPKLQYSEVKNLESDSTASGCSICLQDYKELDMLRLLPQCGHFFHLKCVDHWLRLHPTCPICRNSPLPTPLDTPLVEVVTLANSR